MKKSNKSKAVNLRQIAEELLKKEPVKTGSQLSEADILKLNHELHVHQIELEFQNEELILAYEQAEIAAKKYTKLYDFAPSGHFTLTKEGKIAELNLSGAKMLGKERSLLKNSQFGFFVSNDTKLIFNLFLSKIFYSKAEESCEITLLTDSNLPMYVYLNGIITENDEQCLISAMNITDRKWAAELFIANKEQAFQNKEKEKRAAGLIIANKELNQLLQLNADKDLFISILSHDLRSPFNALLGLSKLLMENIRHYNIDEIENLVNHIYQSAQNTYNLLENILMWSRTHSGKILFEPQNLSFKDICKDILEILKPNADAKNITINYSATDKTYFFADIDMLKAVMRNLVSNAIKFTNNGGQIDIYAEKNHSDVTITVSDNGIGIEPDNLTKLFDISQIQTTTGTGEEKGTGLGLLLCKEFVEKNGGTIWVESKHGKGSKFKFTMPIFTKQAIDRKI
jgi:signal transduction histidine kinase